jgi:hypothetical protein
VHQSFIRYEQHRWLKVSAVVLAVAVGAYLWTPGAERSGDTAVGYALGGAAAGLMVWLTWFGVRKRSYRARGAPLRGWLSAHVYLGLTLVLLVPLHAAFNFGWNVHSLAALLTALTIVSGLVGVVVYVSIPAQMTQNRPGEKLVALFEQVGALDTECTALAGGLATEIADAVNYSVHATRVGGGILRQVAGADPCRPTRRALHVVQRAQDARSLDRATGETLQKLRANLTLKQLVLRRISTDLRLKALLDAWLVLHVPLAIAALAAVAAHVVAVFYYR